MKNSVTAVLRYRFRRKAYFQGTQTGTSHGNGESPISTKGHRQSCSYVPVLSYISKEVEIKDIEHAIHAFTLYSEGQKYISADINLPPCKHTI